MKEKAIALFLTAMLALITIAPVIAAIYTLGDYPKPFCADGDCTNFRIVYGSDAKAEDLAGGSDVIARLSGESYTLVSTTGGAETTVTGEGTRLDTSNNRIIMGECLNNARTTITDTELPTLLADGILYGDDGTAYAYTQDIMTNASACLYYSRSDNDLEDPKLHIEMQASTGYPTYKTKITFSKAVPVNSTDVVDNTITLFGADYSIGSGSDSNTLILYGGADTQVINEGEEVTVTVGGTEYTIGVGGVSGTTTAVISVNGVSESMTQGNTKKISGLDVYLSAVYYYPKEGQVSQAKVSLGSQKITLEDGSEILLGTNDYIDETEVKISGTSTTNTISSFEVEVPAQDEEDDSLEVGQSFSDPVWGTFKLELSGTTPDIDSTAGDVITITGSSDTTSIKFTDYGGTEKTIQFTYDNNTASGTVTLFLQDSSSREYIVKESEHVVYKDYVIVDKADDTHLLQLDSIPSGDVRTTDIIRFTDIFSGTLYEHTFTSTEITDTGANISSMRLGSQDYIIEFFNASSKSDGYIKIYWSDTNALSGDSAASAGVPGYYTLFPQIKANNGEYIIFVNNYTTVPNGSTVVLPAQGRAKESETIDITSYAAGYTSLENKINYTYVNQSGTTITVVPTPLKAYSTGIMILEEERADNYYHAIYIGITETGTTTKTVKVDRPTFSDTASTTTGTGGVTFTTWGSDTYTSEAIDAWGALVKYYNKDEASATITYPDTQLYADIFILTEGAVTSTTATGTGTVKQAVPITWSVSLVDTDIQDPATVSYNLILVGGSCANSLVQELVDDGKLAAKYTCAGGVPGEGWVTGKGYIWLIEDAFKTGQTVLVVAGTEKAQTKTACSVLQKYATLLKDSTATAIEVTSATTAGITPL